ncbi:DNA processing protein DprA [Thiomicrospira aerophila AL3]|uniref:DNA processing protein DprA n=1 Tax=Thiomicrospira aerophila AL3 TaxID=717772 RepID=W0DYQ6_9GAMM|nr:DNA-processing protein DprA [Thiomicrospira aerophila]AHF01991.1 DNA processing protein DprA [Thiomicrospira aerophila AL3]
MTSSLTDLHTSFSLEATPDLSPTLIKRLVLGQASFKNLTALVHAFPSWSAIAQADQQAWSHQAGWRYEAAKRCFEVSAQAIEALDNWLLQPQHHLVLLGDAAYPPLLKTIVDPPIALFVQGDIGCLQRPQFAIVGSRHATRQGLKMTEDFACALANAGLQIVSGLARGIDAAAHLGGLAGLAGTIAVVGTGLDQVYPKAHQRLAAQISEQGALISEYPLGTPPLRHHFPQRNRIISGMALGCLVVEAALQSGSLITARQALEQGREVFAIPGSIQNSLARGPHAMIRQGAKLVEQVDDILEELVPLLQKHQALALTPSHEDAKQPACPNSPSRPATHSLALDSLTAAERSLYQLMEYEAVSLDQLMSLSHLSAAEVQSSMMMLEIAGLCQALSAGRWQRC